MVNEEFSYVIGNLHYAQEYLCHALSTVENAEKPLSIVESDRIQYYTNMINVKLDKINENLKTSK